MEDGGGWLLCKVLFVTFDVYCCGSFTASREEAKLTGLLPTFEACPWVIWFALAAAESRLLAGKEDVGGNRL